MAKKAHLLRLQNGVEGWNRWRSRSRAHPDLSGAFLDDECFIEIDLFGADLKNAVLTRSILAEADLTSADLRGADLSSANLQGASLNEADLSGANLSFADLGSASLCDADLTDAELHFANLTGADLFGADLTNCQLYETIFANVILRDVRGIELCCHEGPSVVDHRTIANSDPLPHSFLKGCGLPDRIIEQMQSHSANFERFHSCFISYSHADRAFAQRLHDALDRVGIRCWLDEHQLLPGDDLHERLGAAINGRDKVLLCCSKDSSQVGG